jgi:transcriptional regulator with XRE-family HTH domain
MNLDRYQIGAKIRALRLNKKLGLVQLGEHTGLSPGMLSRIERDRLVPTLPTLARIAMVFGVGLDHFFCDDREQPTRSVVRKRDRLRLPAQAGEANPPYYFESLDYPVSGRKMEAFYAEFENSPRPMQPHSHPGAEIIYVVSGQLVVSFDGGNTLLEEGDSMYFDSGFPHSYRRQGRAFCSAIVVLAR